MKKRFNLSFFDNKTLVQKELETKAVSKNDVHKTAIGFPDS